MVGDEKNWPAWRYGPKGQKDVFQCEDDVPSGWEDHPSKVKDAPKPAEGTKTAQQSANGSVTEKQAAKTGTEQSQTAIDPKVAAGNEGGGVAPAATQPPPPSETPPSGVELDAHGYAYDPALHAATKSKTNAGLWRMKVGVSRPAPKPGYPLDL